jgi:hypothetical protein
MRFINTQTPTFAGSAGSAGKPAVVETFQLVDKDGSVIGTFTKAVDGTCDFTFAGSFTPTTIVASGGVTSAGYTALNTQTGLRVAHCKYSFATDGGAQGLISPANSDTLPDNAILVGGTINSTTAVDSLGSATVAVGTSAGSSTTSIKAATAKATLSADAVLNAVPVFATPVKLTAAGTITFTIGTADLTQGVIEVWVYYVVAAG